MLLIGLAGTRISLKNMKGDGGFFIITLTDCTNCIKYLGHSLLSVQNSYLKQD